MLQYHPLLPESLWLEIRPIFIDAFPCEAVVAIWRDGTWKHLENVSTEPTNEFKLSAEDSLYLVRNNPALLLHSHTSTLGRADPAPSDRDTESQIATGYTWGIVAVTGNVSLGCVYEAAYPEIWGPERVIPPLEGRPYLWAVRDCWTLCFDYYASLNRKLTPVPRVRNQGPHNNHPRAVDQFSYWAPRLGFERVASRNDRQAGDLVLMHWRSPDINHCAVYLGEGKYLQQHADRLSEITIWNDEENVLERTAAQFWRLKDNGDAGE